MTFTKGTPGRNPAPAPIAPVKGRLLRAHTAAQYLGVTVSRVRALLACGDLLAVRSTKGRLMGIYERDCDAWIAKHQQVAAPPPPRPSGDERIAHLLPTERRFA